MRPSDETNIKQVVSSQTHINRTWPIEPIEQRFTYRFNGIAQNELSCYAWEMKFCDLT